MLGKPKIKLKQKGWQTGGSLLPLASAVCGVFSEEWSHSTTGSAVRGSDQQTNRQHAAPAPAGLEMLTLACFHFTLEGLFYGLWGEMEQTNEPSSVAVRQVCPSSSGKSCRGQMFCRQTKFQIFQSAKSKRFDVWHICVSMRSNVA